MIQPFFSLGTILTRTRSLFTLELKLVVLLASKFVFTANNEATETSGLATQTGLEPATSAVTGRRANQLRYWAFASPTGFEPVLPP